MKRLFSLGMIAALLSAGTFALLQQTSERNAVIVRSDSHVVVVDEPFFVDVLVRAVDDVNAVDLEIAYPETRLTITNLRDGESVLTIWTREPSARNGLVSLRGGTFRRGFSGEHRIIRMQGIATRPGNIQLTLPKAALIKGDGQGTRITSGNIERQELSLRAVSREQAAAEGLTENLQRTDLRTDLTGDGRVTMADISVFLEAWGNRSAIYDFNGDGFMTIRDFSIILADYFRFR